MCGFPFQKVCKSLSEVIESEITYYEMEITSMFYLNVNDISFMSTLFIYLFITVVLLAQELHRCIYI